MDSSPNSCRLFSEWNSSRASCNLAPSFIWLVSHLFRCTGCSLCLWEKKKTLFVGLTLIFFPPCCHKARHQLAPEWRGSVHLLQILSTLRSLRPCLRFRGRVFPPVVKLNFCSSVNYTVNYRVEQTFRPGKKQAIDESHWVPITAVGLCRDLVSSAAGLVQRRDSTFRKVVDLIIAQDLRS